MATSVDITDQVTPALKALGTSLAAEPLNRAIGAAEVVLFQNWFLAMPPNKLGWPSTGFWAKCARATNYRTNAAAVVVSINRQGLRQRFQGGEIHPTGDHKFLTIPARSEAYGKAASDFDNLRVAYGRNGAFALVEADAMEVSIGRKRKDGSRKVTPGADRGGVVMFWLVKSVTQQGDPSVIPPNNLIMATAIETISDIIDRVLRRSGSS